MSFLKEFFTFVLARKKFWLLPIMIALLVVSILVVATEGTAVAPFIYAIF
jgi:competence protein ComGC|tara:strand:- start:550 stop:699 length:150 start_codon:yes stop_codon:yes gene_type:complete